MPRARMAPAVKALLRESLASPEAGAPRDGKVVVVETVRRWIFEGQLRDGDVLSQEDLAEILGLSRIPVRDGLISLEAGGWVSIDPGVGARAIGLDEPSIRDSFELFGHIWTLLIRRAVERRGDATSVADAAKRVRAATTPGAMTRANDEFVSGLRQLANSARIDAVYRNASRIVPGDFFAVVPHALSVQRRHVPRIGDAILRGDLEAGAHHAMAQHRAHATNIVTLLHDRGVLDQASARKRSIASSIL